MALAAATDRVALHTLWYFHIITSTLGFGPSQDSQELYTGPCFVILARALHLVRPGKESSVELAAAATS